MYLNTTRSLETRRRFLRKLIAAGGLFTINGLAAEALATVAPRLTQGPYYPLDKDNDLVRIGDNDTIAQGQIHYLHGRILDANGEPVRGALVELWHADYAGEYSYYQSVGPNPDCDPNFAGFGQFLTGFTGAYLFRTIKAGLFIIRGQPYQPSNSSDLLYQLSFPAYTGYTYEVYANPTLADLEWKAVPFSLEAGQSPDRNKHTMTSDGSLTLYTSFTPERGFYKVSYRIPRANTGTP